MAAFHVRVPQVKSAPRIVQAQAFFKLSFVQWESDSLSFSEAVEEARLTAQNSASSSALDRMSFASGPSSALTVSGNSYIFPALASLNVDDSDRRARGGLWRRLMRALRGGGGAGEGGRGRVRPSNKQRGPAGGSRLYVDVRMEPTVGNFLRVMLLDPVHPNSMFKVGGKPQSGKGPSETGGWEVVMGFAGVLLVQFNSRPAGGQGVAVCILAAVQVAHLNPSETRRAVAEQNLALA